MVSWPTTSLSLQSGRPLRQLCSVVKIAEGVWPHHLPQREGVLPYHWLSRGRHGFSLPQPRSDAPSFQWHLVDPRPNHNHLSAGVMVCLPRSLGGGKNSPGERLGSWLSNLMSSAPWEMPDPWLASGWVLPAPQSPIHICLCTLCHSPQPSHLIQGTPDPPQAAAADFPVFKTVSPSESPGCPFSDSDSS